MKVWHRMGLRAQLMVGFLVVYVMVVLFMTHSLSQWSMEKLHASQGQLLTQLAQQMSRALDKDMYERYREISNLARLPLMSRQDITAEMRRDHFNRLKATHSYYAWIDQTDADGNILIGTDGLLEGKNVAKRDWFVEGRAGMHVGDVHDAFLLAKLLPKPANDPLPLRLVDVSAPIVNAEGSVLGVLCGHLGWHWAIDVRSQLLAPLGEDRQIDILVLNREGKVLLGTPELLPNSEGLAMSSVRHAVSGKPATLVDVWPDGRAYLTASAVSGGFEDYPGLGWIVMVRQPVEEAFADADAMVG